MVNEISGIGSASVTHGLGHVGSPPSAVSRGGTSKVIPESQASQVGMPKNNYAELIAQKDEVLDVAQSARKIGKTLEQAGELIDRMDQEVRQVKNYPPFPAGNEQRAQFINSLNGLRRQLEALTVPAVKDGMEPVFYPREAKLDNLFASASDEEVAMFSAGLGRARENLEAGRAELGTQLLGATMSSPELPDAALDDAGAQALVGTLAGQLSGAPQARLGNSAYLAKI